METVNTNNPKGYTLHYIPCFCEDFDHALYIFKKVAEAETYTDMNPAYHAKFAVKLGNYDESSFWHRLTHMHNVYNFQSDMCLLKEVPEIVKEVGKLANLNFIKVDDFMDDASIFEIHGVLPKFKISFWKKLRWLFFNDCYETLSIDIYTDEEEPEVYFNIW